MSLLKSKKNKSKSKREAVSSLHVLSYRLLNDHVQSLYPRLTTLENNLKQAMMPIPFDVYVCGVVLFSMIAGIVGIIVGAAVALLVSIQPAAFAVVLPILGGVGIGGIVFFVLLTIPVINVKNRAAKLAEEIPHFISYMATLATSGLSLEGIFKAIAKEDTDEEIVKDCRFITRNIEILGMDLLSAITDLIKRSPKGSYSELLEGAIITTQTGGNLFLSFIGTNTRVCLLNHPNFSCF